MRPLRTSIALLFSLVATACAASAPDVIPIPIDHAGFAGRLRRVCELGKGGSIEGACATGAPRPSDEDGSAGREEVDGGEEGAETEEGATETPDGAPEDVRSE